MENIYLRLSPGVNYPADDSGVGAMNSTCKSEQRDTQELMIATGRISSQNKVRISDTEKSLSLAVVVFACFEEIRFNFSSSSSYYYCYCRWFILWIKEALDFYSSKLYQLKHHKKQTFTFRIFTNRRKISS